MLSRSVGDCGLNEHEPSAAHRSETTHVLKGPALDDRATVERNHNLLPSHEYLRLVAVSV